MSTEKTTAIQRAPSPAFDFSPEQRRIILDSFLNGASEAEATVLMELAKLRRLNPITQQIHFVKRWNSQRRAEVWQSQVSIDGFRAIAERTGLYDGQDEPEYEYDAKGGMKLARVRVYRKDIGRPFVGVAHFTEYAQTKREGGLNIMWATKPHIMLAKCAEALAFRKAFPEDTSGLYSPEEMPEVVEKEVNVPPEKTEPSGDDKALSEGKRTTQRQLSAKSAAPAPAEKPAMESSKTEEAAFKLRRLVLWKTVEKTGASQEDFRQWTAQCLGVVKGSQDITLQDVEKLEAELKNGFSLVPEPPAGENPLPSEPADDGFKVPPVVRMTALANEFRIPVQDFWKRAEKQLGKKEGWTHADVELMHAELLKGAKK